jgi:hypothetical protein
MSNVQIPLLLFGGVSTGNKPVVPAPTLAPKVFGPRNLVSSRLPEFVRHNHETFVAFMEAYYEWLESYGGGFYGVGILTELVDVDRTLDEFIKAFKSTYMVGFPEKLAVSEDGNPINERNLLKNIREFYKNKGTEKGYSLLMRILLNVTAEIRYPKKNILRSSDGKWTDEISIKVTSSNGEKNFQMEGLSIRQKNRFTNIVSATANVSRVLQYSLDQYDITELFLENIFGDFSSNSPIECVLPDGTILKESVFSVLSSFLILDGGRGYKPGDKILFAATTNGYGGIAEVAITSPFGEIQNINIIDFGVNYIDEEEVFFLSTTGSGTAKAITKVGAICKYSGYWNGNDGKVSSNKHLFDGHYYQDFSYVVACEASLNLYKDAVLRLIHPSGTKMFGLFLANRIEHFDVNWFSMHSKYEIPIIGNYMPYRLSTIADLWYKYECGFNSLAKIPGITYQNDLRLLLETKRLGGFTAGSLAAFVDFTQSGNKTTRVMEAVLYPHGSTQSNYMVLYGASSSHGFTNIGGATGIFNDGHTVNVVEVWNGEGFVVEFDNFDHNPDGNPYGDGSTLYGQSYWYTYHHPNTRGIKNLTGLNSGTGFGASFGAMITHKFFRMPFGYQFHSNPGTGPYEGTEGVYNEYSINSGLNSPNIGIVPECP